MLDETQKLIKKQGLTEQDLADIAHLAELCNASEGLNLKLNWDILRTRRQDRTNDFLYYEHGMLVGFLALFQFNSKEAEISGMVHPEHRRKGIFTTLLEAARSECQGRGTSGLFLIVEHSASSGQAFVRALGADYHHSEYKMLLESPEQPARTTTRIHIRTATATDAQILAHITAVSFGLDEQETIQWYNAEAMERSRNLCYYLATLDDVPVGKLDVAFGEQGAFIYGFGVLPEYRGQGYGREILAKTIDLILARGEQSVALEVETNNSHALGLYHSCGFREVTSYDYYRLPTE